jgi:hypothetical protein
MGFDEPFQHTRKPNRTIARALGARPPIGFNVIDFARHGYLGGV